MSCFFVPTISGCWREKVKNNGKGGAIPSENYSQGMGA